MSQQLPPSAVSALHAGNKMEAIKLTREATNLGLKEAKELVEAYVATSPALQAQLQAQSSSSGSLLSSLFMIILVVAAVVYFWPD